MSFTKKRNRINQTRSIDNSFDKIWKTRSGFVVKSNNNESRYIIVSNQIDKSLQLVKDFMSFGIDDYTTTIKFIQVQKSSQWIGQNEDITFFEIFFNPNQTLLKFKTGYDCSLKQVFAQFIETLCGPITLLQTFEHQITLEISNENVWSELEKLIDSILDMSVEEIFKVRVY